jgi:hypothetical protein
MSCTSLILTAERKQEMPEMPIVDINHRASHGNGYLEVVIPKPAAVIIFADKVMIISGDGQVTERELMADHDHDDPDPDDPFK